MITAYWLFVCYFVLPASLGKAGREIERQRLWPHFLSQVKARTKNAGPQPVLAGIITATFAVLLLLFGHKLAGGQLRTWLPVSASLITFICTSVLLYLRFRKTISTLIEIRPTKFLISILGLSVAWLSNVYADAVMIDITETINPSDLPSAKAGIFAIVALMTWTAVVSLLALIPYLIMAVSPGILASQHKARARANMMLKLPQLAPVKPSSHLVDLALFFGLAYSSVFPLHLIDITSKNPAFEPFVRKLIAFASFHMQESSCAGQQPEGSTFALIGYERVAVAIPDGKLGYRFKLVKCAANENDSARIPRPSSRIALPTNQISI